MGLAAAFALTRLITSLLFGVSPRFRNVCGCRRGARSRSTVGVLPSERAAPRKAIRWWPCVTSDGSGNCRFPIADWRRSKGQKSEVKKRSPRAKYKERSTKHEVQSTF